MDFTKLRFDRALLDMLSLRRALLPAAGATTLWLGQELCGTSRCQEDSSPAPSTRPPPTPAAAWDSNWDRLRNQEKASRAGRTSEVVRHIILGKSCPHCGCAHTHKHTHTHTCARSHSSESPMLYNISPSPPLTTTSLSNTCTKHAHTTGPYYHSIQHAHTTGPCVLYNHQCGMGSTKWSHATMRSERSPRSAGGRRRRRASASPPWRATMTPTSRRCTALR